MKQSIVLVIFAFYLAPSVGTATTTIANIQCGDGTTVGFELTIPDIAQWQEPSDPALWQLIGNANANSTCQPTINASTVSYSNIDSGQCGVWSEHNSNTQLKLEFTIDAKKAGSGATHAYDHSYTIQCIYDKQKNNIQANFLPQHSITDDEQDSGTLDFKFELLDSQNNVLDPVTNGPFDLKATLTGRLTVTNVAFPNKTFDVHYKIVNAADNGAGSSPILLIENGCNKVTYVGKPSCGKDGTETFSLDVFRFVGQTGNAKVYLFITAVVCLEDGGANTTCETQCGDNCVQNSKRRRRYTEEEAVKAQYFLKFGPIEFEDVQKEEKADAVVDEDEGSSVPAHYVAVGVVGGVVAVAIVCVAVVIVLRKRRYGATLAEPRSAHEAATPGV